MFVIPINQYVNVPVLSLLDPLVQQICYFSAETIHMEAECDLYIKSMIQCVIFRVKDIFLAL